jgi:sulfur-oxidizing protein SoxY
VSVRTAFSGILALSAAPIAALACIAALSASPASAADTDKTFATFKEDAFGPKPIVDNSPIVTMNAPIRAEDAAVVPIDVAVALPAGDKRTISKVTLVVDENPSPIAASFTLGQKRQEFALSTRLRVNAYSSVRAVVETDDGALHMTSRYVKASGGCSAPALKDEDEALARIGETRFRPVSQRQSTPKPEEQTSTPVSEAQLMIRHPNYSGLQMNQVDRTYIPAKFVNHIVVKQGDETVFTMEGGISLSEDPAIQFTYPQHRGELTMVAEDTDGKTFSGAMKDAGKKSGT